METQAHENWLPIPGYEGLYEVSDFGRVRGLERVINTARGWSRTIHPCILSPGNDRGYWRVVLRDHPRRKKSHWVHRLVLTAFVGPCPPGMETLHGVGGSTDNSLENLRWGTSSENNRDIVRHGHNLNANKTSCMRDHPLTGYNLLHLPTGRACRACARERSHSHAHGKPFSLAAADARYASYAQEDARRAGAKP